ncbi:hypothetical protein PTKIN_Ptkin02bG0198200 [Pterospermum kingtungense]
MNPDIQHSSFATKSDTYMKVHNKRKREGEDCASSAFYANMDCNQEDKRKEKASIVVDAFDPFAIPNLSRALDRSKFGSVTEEIEALRAKMLKRMNPSPQMKPTQSFMRSGMGKSKRRCVINLEEEHDNKPAYQDVIDKQVSPSECLVDVDRWVSQQADETFSDQSVTRPTQDVIHLEDDHTGDGDKGVTMPILIIDSDDESDGIRRPSHQFHKAVQKGPASESSMNDLMVMGSPEKEALKEEVGSAATKMDIGVNKSIDVCDSYVGVRFCVERKAPKEEVGNKLDEIAFGMDESIDQVTGFSEGKASEEVQIVPNIDAKSVINTCIETDGNMMIKEENDQIDIADDMGSKPCESVDQVTSCPERKASKGEVESVPKINVKSAKNTYIEADDIMMIKEDNDQIDIADDMGSKPSETVDQVTSFTDRKASEEVETVTNVDVRSAKNTYIETDDIMMIKEGSDQIEATDDRESKSSENAIEMFKHVDHIGKESSDEELEVCPDIAVKTDKGMYIGTCDDLVIEEDNNQAVAENDGLEDVWNEMKFALECSKDIAAVPIAHEQSEEDEDCDHSFVLKDDLGLVCRICGVIERSIDNIFEFQYSKVKRTVRTYRAEPQNMSNRGLNEVSPTGVNSIGDNSILNEIYVHPRHKMQMKPHQVEGFNFLCSNLLADDPGGCILAHAPGSGKTFMIISFIQSFLAKYPQGRPLVILPKGILANWKKEFQTWQIEDIPLLDFYTSKAENRQQQLDVLLKWEEQKSILFLGYKQFSAIVCDNRICKVAAECQNKLLKVPTILILDEGHTPRNEQTDVLQSIAKVRTPRKVVLSGTLFQNHVKEVFNILNLVRPKFLKFKTSRDATSRIMSKVQITGARKHLKAGNDLAFFELVEYTLQKDENLERKAAVIRDLREMTSNVLHYYKGDCLDELPGLVDFTIVLKLSAKQKEEVQKLNKLDKFTQMTVGSALYVHPYAAGHSKSSVNNELIDQILEKIDVRHGVKLKFFLSLLGLCESTGEKLLVFGQFILPLKLLERASMKSKGWNPGKEIFSVTGDSTPDQRDWSMQRFNSSPDAKVFFGSIKACGEGISLVGASRILILDVHLNPSVTRQAIGRAFRPGQKNIVYTYRLVAADSPEEENHLKCFKKESISKLWFEWSESCQFQDFDMKAVELDNCGDMFLESPFLQEDIKILYKKVTPGKHIPMGSV